MSLKGR